MEILLQAEGLDGVKLVLHPIDVPEDDREWIVALLGGPVDVATESLTELGWPVLLAFGRVRDASGVVAYRVGAFYRFFHFRAAAVATFADLPTLMDRLHALVACWQTGRPDFGSQEVKALSELFTDGPQLH